MTPYIDLFRTLNPETHKHEQEVLEQSSVEISIRNRLNVTPDIKERLQNTFGWKSHMFDTEHVVRFPNPIICITGVGSPVMDVNYQWCTEYFHFITEVLPNILFMLKYYPEAQIFCKTSPFTIPLLRWFGVDNPVVNDIPNQRMKIEAPFVECGNPSPFKLGLLTSRVEKNLKFEKTHGILIHRQTSRRILNEQEVFDYLKQRFPHLHWVVFDSLSTEDTAHLFSKAAVIVAPHGAGLTNMIFSPPRTPVIEFMPEQYPNICYWHMCEMLKNPYTMVPIRIQTYQWDMKVCIDTLDSNIKNLML